MLAKARALWPLEVIEEALGTSAARALLPGLRTRRVALRLSSYQAATFEYLAAQQETTVGDLLWFQLDGLGGSTWRSCRRRLRDSEKRSRRRVGGRGAGEPAFQR